MREAANERKFEEREEGNEHSHTAQQSEFEKKKSFNDDEKEKKVSYCKLAASAYVYITRHCMYTPKYSIRYEKKFPFLDERIPIKVDRKKKKTKRPKSKQL